MPTVKSGGKIHEKTDIILGDGGILNFGLPPPDRHMHLVVVCEHRRVFYILCLPDGKIGIFRDAQVFYKGYQRSGKRQGT